MKGKTGKKKNIKNSNQSGLTRLTRNLKHEIEITSQRRKWKTNHETQSPITWLIFETYFHVMILWLPLKRQIQTT